MIASAIYIGATAFEVAQNSADRWYLTEVTRSVADLFFNSLMTMAFSIYTIGFSGNGLDRSAYDSAHRTLPVSLTSKNHPSHRGINGTVILIATTSIYWITKDPIVFLFLVFTGVGVYFITFLMKTACAVVTWLRRLFLRPGVSCLAVGDHKTPPMGSKISWLTFGIATAIIVATAAAITPVLSRAKATPRQYS